MSVFTPKADKDGNVRFVIHGAEPVFYLEDLPDISTGDGFSIYRGVLVQWDNDHDKQVFAFIDALPDADRQQLLAVYEHKGEVDLLWRFGIPTGYADGSGVESARDGGYYWTILRSRYVPYAQKPPEP